LTDFPRRPSLTHHERWRSDEDSCLDFLGTFYSASTWIVPILIAITFHEAAHAYAAWKLGMTPRTV
jgi:hypothetical protein